MVDVSGLIDFETGAQSKRIFWDQDIYEQELERVFGRAWLFLTHESAVPQSGDFFSTYMGEDAVIVVRQDDGGIGAFLNYCQHRGNQLCYADSGNVSAFSCNYHGWAYGRNGDLVGVPLEQEVYFNELNKQEFGLRRVARVESYKGLVFGCFDADAPSLADYLGDMGWYMDSFLEGSGGATIVGPPMK
ncbi:MAG: Rieske 2Fe-2S domain-containing protein, partial [Pseudomonadota bacterium]|nr:Rieske 2Fe-2S domain-containing protein [Pseudomonadota bacterium]